MAVFPKFRLHTIWMSPYRQCLRSRKSLQKFVAGEKAPRNSVMQIITDNWNFPCWYNFSIFWNQVFPSLATWISHSPLYFEDPVTQNVIQVRTHPSRKVQRFWSLDMWIFSPLWMDENPGISRLGFFHSSVELPLNSRCLAAVERRRTRISGNFTKHRWPWVASLQKTCSCTCFFLK